MPFAHATKSAARRESRDCNSRVADLSRAAARSRGLPFHDHLDHAAARPRLRGGGARGQRPQRLRRGRGGRGAGDDDQLPQGVPGGAAVKSNHHISRGESQPYRLVSSTFDTGNNQEITFEFDFTQNGEVAQDFPTRFNNLGDTIVDPTPPFAPVPTPAQPGTRVSHRQFVASNDILPLRLIIYASFSLLFFAKSNSFSFFI